MNVRETRLDHEGLMRRMEALGYEVNHKGMCFGVAALQAVIFIQKGKKGIEELNQWMSRMYTITPEEFAKEKALQEKPQKQGSAEARLGEFVVSIKSEVTREALHEMRSRGWLEKGENLQGEELNEEQKKQLDVIVNRKLEESMQADMPHEYLLGESRALFDSINTYMQVYKTHPELFEHPKAKNEQDILQTSRLFIPQTGSGENEELVAQYPHPLTGSYKQGEFNDELTVYTQSLRDILQAEPAFNHPVSLLLRASNHAVFLGLDTETCIYGNANRLPATFFVDSKQIGDSLLNGFSDNDVATFETEIFAAPEHIEELNAKIELWRETEDYKKLHAVNAEKIEQQDSAGVTWLYTAAMFADSQNVNALIEQGANPGQETADGSTPIFIAVISGHDQVLAELLKNDDSTLANQKIDGVPLLYLAATMGDVNVTDVLLKKGANPALSITDDTDATPLQAAVDARQADVVSLLLKNGADARQSVDGISLCFVAVRKADHDVAEVLLAYGADVDEVVVGLTLLSVAVQNKDLKMAQLLLDRGARVDKPCADGMTPLLMAIQINDANMAKLLMRHGASLDVSYQGKTIAAIAAEEASAMIIVVIKEEQALQSGHLNEPEKNEREKTEKNHDAGALISSGFFSYSGKESDESPSIPEKPAEGIHHINIKKIEK